MTDIASLEIKVDSTSVVNATKQLDNLAQSARAANDAAAGLTKFAGSLKAGASDIEKAAAKNKESLSTYHIEKYNRVMAAAAGETDKLRKSDINSYVTYLKKMEAAYKENEKIQLQAIAAQKKAQEQMVASTAEATKAAAGYDLLTRSMKTTVVNSAEARGSMSSLLGVVKQQETAAIQAAQGYDLMNKSMKSVTASSTQSVGLGALLGMGGASVEKTATSLAGLSMAYGKSAVAAGELGSVSAITGRSIAKTAESIKDVEVAATKSGAGLKNLADSMQKFLLVGAGIATLTGVFQKLKESIGIAADFEKMNKTLALTSSSTGEVATDMEFLKKVSRDLGLNLVSTGEAFSKLKASALGTALQGEQVKTIFLSVSKAMAGIGASEGETTGALRAIGQMMNKGKIMAEELRGQLGEHLPGALNIMARALGVSTQELDKMVTKGLDANTVLPKFAAELDKLGDKAKFDSIENNLNRIATAFQLITEKAVQASGIPKIIQGIADVVTPVDNSIEGIKKRINDLTSRGPSSLGRSVLYEDFKREYAELNRQLDEAIAKQERLEKQARRQGRFTGGSVGAVGGAPAFGDVREQDKINEARKKGEQQLKTLESERLQISIAMLRAKGDELGAIRAEADATYKNKAQADEAYKMKVELYQLEQKNREAKKSSTGADDSEAKAIAREKERQQRLFENMTQELMMQTAKYEGMSEADIKYDEGLRKIQEGRFNDQQKASLTALLDRAKWQEESTTELQDALKAEEDMRKAAADAEKQSQKDVRDEALRTLEVMSSNLEYAREMATGLADAFGDVGAAIGGVSVAMAEYAKQQETIRIQKDEDIQKHPERQMQIEEAAAVKSARSQIKAYGDMTQAAQGFFKKNSSGYKTMEMTTKAFRAIEIALSVKSMLQELFAENAKTTAVVTGQVEQTAATVAGSAEQAAANAAATPISATKAVADASGGDPYTGLVRGAAMLAFMVAIGALASGASASSTAGESKTPEQVIQDRLDAAMKAEGGSVFGSTDVSNSILDALELLASNSSIDLDYTKGMKRSLELLAFNVDAAALQIVGGVLPSATALGKLGVQRKDNFSQTGNKAGDAALTTLPIIGSAVGLVDAIMGSTKITRTLTDYGVLFYDQSLKSIIKTSMVLASTYTDVEVKKNTSAMFGMMTSESKKTETTYELLSNSISKSIGKVVIGIANNITKAADLLHVGGSQFEMNLMKFNVSLGKMSTFYTAGDLVKLVSAKLNKVSDQMAQKAFAGMGLNGFQKVGEGFFKTMARVASGVATAEGVLKQFGVTAVSFKTLDAAAKQGDVAVEIFRKSMIESIKTPRDVAEILKDAYATTVGDLSDFTKALYEFKDALAKTGSESMTMTQGMINAAGGITALNDSINAYFDLFFTDQEKMAANSASLARRFRTLNLVMPSLAPSLDALTGQVKPATDSFRALVTQLSNYTNDAGKELYAQVLALGSAFSDAANESAKASQKVLDSAKVLADDSKRAATEAAKSYSAYMQEIFTMNGDSASASALKRQDETDAMRSTIEAMSADIAKRKLLIEQLGSNATSTDIMKLSQDEANLAVNQASLDLREYLNKLIAQDEAVVQAQKNLDTATKALTDNWKIITEDAAKNLKDRQTLEKSLFDASALAQQSDAELQNKLNNAVKKSADEAAKARQDEIDAMDESLRSFATAVDKLALSKDALTTATTGMQEAYDALSAMSERFSGLVSGLKAYKAELNATDVSLTKEQKYLAAKNLFTATATAASTYNPNESSKAFEQAVADLPAVSKAFLEASAQFGTATPQYQSDLAAVKAAVDAAINTTQTQIDIMRDQLKQAEIANDKLAAVNTSTGGVTSKVNDLASKTADFTKAQSDYNAALASALQLLPSQSSSELAMGKNTEALKLVLNQNAKDVKGAIDNMQILLSGYNAAKDAQVAAAENQAKIDAGTANTKIDELIEALGTAKTGAKTAATQAATDLAAAQKALTEATNKAIADAAKAAIAIASQTLFKQITSYEPVKTAAAEKALTAATTLAATKTTASNYSTVSLASSLATQESTSIQNAISSAQGTAGSSQDKAEISKQIAILPLQLSLAQQRTGMYTKLYEYAKAAGLNLSNTTDSLDKYVMPKAIGTGSYEGRNALPSSGYTKFQVQNAWDAWSLKNTDYANAQKALNDAVSASYLTGTSSVPEDMTANIHKGEKIIDPTSSAILNRYGIQVKTDTDGQSFKELKAQTHELQALVRLQSAANQEMIKELKGVKMELAEVSRKAKIEAAA